MSNSFRFVVSKEYTATFAALISSASAMETGLKTIIIDFTPNI